MLKIHIFDNFTQNFQKKMKQSNLGLVLVRYQAQISLNSAMLDREQVLHTKLSETQSAKQSDRE